MEDYYRINFSYKPYMINVLYLGMDSVDDSISADYDQVDKLPRWMQERLSVLNMLSSSPPTEVVSGVGRRISKDTYWVERPDSC